MWPIYVFIIGISNQLYGVEWILSSNVNRLFVQEIFRLCGIWKCITIYKSPILKLMNVAHTLMSFFSKINVNIIFPSTPTQYQTT